MKNELEVLSQYTKDEMQVITSTIAKNATPEELGLFLYRCKLLNLNPLKPGQIHFMKYGTGVGTIVVGIEGFRSIAARTGKLTGIKRGAIKDSKGSLIGAWAEVYRSDWKECAREEVPLNEYNKGNSTWKSMPETMIKKVAEAAALRMAFPDDLGGVYESAEMDQANKEEGTQNEKQNKKEVTSINGSAISNVKPVVQTPSKNTEVIEAKFTEASESFGHDSGNDFHPGFNGAVPSNGIDDTYSQVNVDPNYKITFGKYKDQTIEQVGIENIGSYIGSIERMAKEKGETIKGQVLTLIEQYEARIPPKKQ